MPSTGAALAPLLAILKDKAGASRRAREYVAGAVMNLTLKQPSMQAEVAKGGAVPLLVEMLAEKEGQMEEVAGALTKYAVLRTCFLNMVLLMAGGLYMLVLDWNGGHFMWIASGYVPRAEVLELASVCSSAAARTRSQST